MAKKNTRHVKMGKFEISSHAQNRTVESKRNLSKLDMVKNLFGKSLESKPYIHSDGKTEQYDRLNKNNRTVTNIIKKGHVVKTIRKYHKRNENKELKKFGEKR